MKIIKITGGSMASNCYLAWNEESKEGVVIDPGFADEYIYESINKYGINVEKILLTHGHIDHIEGVLEIVDKTGGKVYIHNDDKECLTSANANLSGMLGAPKVFTEADVIFWDGDVIDCGSNVRIKVIHTPGHTEGSCCFLYENVLFSGDTLFEGSIGRTDFPGGSYEKMMDSLKKLMKLDDEVSVLPGHGDNTTISYEKARNPFIVRG